MDQGLNKILKDNDRQLRLNDDGYTIFPFLDDKEIGNLTEYFFSVQKELPERFYSSTHASDPEFRKNTSEFIKSVVSSKVENKFSNYRLLGGAFVVKPPKGKGLLPPHQDWNIVNEELGRSYNIWVPLCNVTVENGAVFVLPGSHNKFPTYRGPGIDSIYKNIENIVWESLTPLPMRSGEALLYDHALLHASPVNQTETIRLGIVCGIIPADKQMQLHFKTGEGISTYQVTEDFFLQHDPMKGPVGLQLISSIDRSILPLSSEQYRTLFLKDKSSNLKSWLQKLFR